MKLKKLIIATSVALSLSFSLSAVASTERNNIEDQRIVNEYVSERSNAKRTKLKPEINEIVSAHKDKDSYFSYKILYTLYSDKDSGFYSLYYAEKALENLATVSNGMFATFSINEYNDPKSPFHNPEKAALLSIKCAELGNESCLTTLYSKALMDAGYVKNITPKIRSKMLDVANKGFRSHNGTLIYARAVGTGLVMDNGKADEMVKQAARELHAPSLDMVVNLYKEEFYFDNVAQNTFFYSYLKAISTNDLSQDTMGQLFQLTKKLKSDEIGKLLAEANEILKAKKYHIPAQFRTP